MSWWTFSERKRWFSKCAMSDGQVFLPAARYSCHSSSRGETILRLHDNRHRQEHSACQVVNCLEQLTFTSPSVSSPLLSSQSIRVRWPPLTLFQEGDHFAMELQDDYHVQGRCRKPLLWLDSNGHGKHCTPPAWPGAHNDSNERLCNLRLELFMNIMLVC